MASIEEIRFRDAFEQYADALFRHAFFRLSDRDRAYDIVQDAFLKAWDYVVAGGTVRHYRSFLYRTVHNLIIDEYRKKRTQSLDELMDDETHAPHIEAAMAEGSLAETEEAIDEHALLDRILAHIPELPAPYRDVLALRFVDGFGPGEIAEMLQVSENVVSVRIHRGLAKLRLLCQN